MPAEPSRSLALLVRINALHDLAFFFGDRPKLTHAPPPPAELRIAAIFFIFVSLSLVSLGDFSLIVVFFFRRRVFLDRYAFDQTLGSPVN